MKKTTLLITISAVILALIFLLGYLNIILERDSSSYSMQALKFKDLSVFDPENKLMEITYLGDKLWVDRKSPKFNQSQAEQVEMLLMNYRVPQNYDTIYAVWETFELLTIPGEGNIRGGFGNHTPFGHFTYFGVQIPNRKRILMFVFRADSLAGSWEFFDRFVYGVVDPPRVYFKTKGDTITYHDQYRDMKVIRTKKIKKE